MRLIQLGDLTDRGHFIPETIAFVRDLAESYPEKTVFLKGNHEVDVLARWRAIEDAQKGETSNEHTPSNQAMMRDAGIDIIKYYITENSTFQQYFTKERAVLRLASDMEWLEARPYYWENDNVFVSHAGISAYWDSIDEALQADHSESILWTRSVLKNIGKLQVIGHTPLASGFPKFRAEENCWNIDTGAVFGRQLSALHLTQSGEVLDSISIPTARIDYQRVAL